MQYAAEATSAIYSLFTAISAQILPCISGIIRQGAIHVENKSKTERKKLP